MSINVNSTQITALLQLYPMAIPGAEENLQPPKTYDLGISQSIYSPTIKLFIVIDPVRLFSTSFTAGDSVRLWVNSLATSVIKLIKPGEENDRIFMDAPWGVLKDGLNRLYYEVTRVSGNKDQSTPILNVLFNNPVSGITVSHPPSIVPGQSPTVTLTRSDPRQFDEMELTIGSWSKTIPYVHPANPVTYNLTTLDLQQIGDGTRTVSATIKDQLSNLRASPTTSITITANQKVLNPPIIVEAEANNRVLDIPALAGKDATIHALTWTGILVGQQIWLKLTGRKPDGSAVTLQIWNGGASKVNANWISQGFWPKPLPASFLTQLAEASSLLLEFWVSEDKSNNFATATKFADQVYTIKAAALVVPTITSVKGSPSNVEIPENGITFENSVTLTGTADNYQKVDVFDDITSIGDATADDKGNWTKSVSGMAPGTHPFTAKAIYGSGQVSDVRTLRVFQLATIRVGMRPTSVAIHPDGFHAYVTNSNGESVSVIDTRSQAVIKTIPVPAGTNPFGVVFHPDGTHAYMVGDFSNTFFVIDTQSQTVIKTIPVGSRPQWIAVHPDGGRAYVPNYYGNSISVIDTLSLTVIQTIPVGAYPVMVAFHPDGSHAYLPHMTGNSVSVIDTRSLTVIKSIALKYQGGAGIVVHPDGSRAYVIDAHGTNASDYLSLSVIDTSSLTVIQSISLQAYTSPFGLAVHPDGSLLYLTNYTSNSVWVIDPKNLTVIKSIPSGTSPYCAAVHPDGTRLYVTNESSDTVSVIPAK